MQLEKFVDIIAGEFDHDDKSIFHPDIHFKQLESWGSMRALLIIAKIEEEYNVVLSANDMEQANTLRNIFDIVNSRQNGN